MIILQGRRLQKVTKKVTKGYKGYKRLQAPQNNLFVYFIQREPTNGNRNGSHRRVPPLSEELVGEVSPCYGGGSYRSCLGTFRYHIVVRLICH